MPQHKSLLDDLLHFPNQAYHGELLADFFVSPDMIEDKWNDMRQFGMKERPSLSVLADSAYDCSILNIAYSGSRDVWISLKNRLCSGNVCVVSSHAGINWPGQDGRWRYNPGNGEYPLVEDLLKELDVKGFDMIYLHLCNRGKYNLAPENTPVIHMFSVPFEETLNYVLVNPVKHYE